MNAARENLRNEVHRAAVDDARGTPAPVEAAKPDEIALHCAADAFARLDEARAYFLATDPTDMKRLKKACHAVTHLCDVVKASMGVVRMTCTGDTQ